MGIFKIVQVYKILTVVVLILLIICGIFLIFKNESTAGYYLKDESRITENRERQIYSAFYDDRPQIKELYAVYGQKPLSGVVRIIGMVQHNISQKNLKCHLKYNHSESVVTVPAQVYISSEIQPKLSLLVASFFICGVFSSISNSTTALPVSIALSDNKLNQDNIDFIPVRYPLENNQSKESLKLAVCVPPLFNNNNKHQSLIEYIEIYKLLGVNHFFFYNLSMTNHETAVLDYYRNLGQVTVELWKFYGHEVNKEVYYNGILSAMNDCLYRASFVHGFEYVVNADIDEILFPRRHNNLIELLDTVDPWQACIMFRNAFFFKKIKNKSTAGYTLLTQTNMLRSLKILPPHQRSKYIYKGKGVIELGNHVVMEYYPGYREYVLPVNIGLCHHYRNTFGERHGALDTRAERYGVELAANVEKTVSEIIKTKYV